MILQKQTNRALVRSAFTLMEILVVVAIIVALAGVGGYYFMNTLKQSQIKVAQAQVKTTLQDAVKQYMIDHNYQVPQQLEVLTVADLENNIPAYLSKDALFDPWGGQYRIDPGQVNGEGLPRIYTTGPTGVIANFNN